LSSKDPRILREHIFNPQFASDAAQSQILLNRNHFSSERIRTL